MIKEEFKALGTILKEYSQVAIVLGMAMLFVILHHEHSVGEHWMNHGLYYFVLPVVVIAVFLRKNPLDFGLRVGNYRLWLVFVGIAILIIIPVLIYSANNESLRRFYSRQNIDLGVYVLKKAAALFAWEFFFRGFMLFGLRERFKEGSIIIQMVPFALMHVGKPEVEALSCIITGVLFGFVAYRSNSFWPAFIIHFILNVSNIVVMTLLV